MNPDHHLRSPAVEDELATDTSPTTTLIQKILRVIVVVVIFSVDAALLAIPVVALTLTFSFGQRGSALDSTSFHGYALLSIIIIFALGYIANNLFLIYVQAQHGKEKRFEDFRTRLGSGSLQLPNEGETVNGDVDESNEERKNDESAQGFRGNVRSAVNVLLLALLDLLIVEVLLWFAIPRSSAFPYGYRNMDVTHFSSGDCNYTGLLSTAQSFYLEEHNCDIVFDNFALIVGGAPKNFHSALGMTVGDTVYITDSREGSSPEYCPDVGLLVHEIAHVFQFQHGLWFSPLADVLWERAKGEVKCSACLYDYGGLEGLIAANETGKSLFDFGLEMQAEILQDFYYFTRDITLQGSEPQKFQLLKQFALELLENED